MPSIKTKLVELVGGAADGKSIRIPAYATIIAVPTGRGRNYRELVYTQTKADPGRYSLQS